MTNIKKIYIFIVCFNINFYLSYGQEKCKTWEWKCKNNECIEYDELCDGVKHCTDGSDETTESCLQLKCPNYSFKCSYGACVAGTALCNNVKDCDDNSDEAPGVCTNATRESNCPVDSYECKNGECISIDLACDGKKDCADTSDETNELCGGSYCQAFAFRCGYGACISGEKKCNGVHDCVDGSDENLGLCGTPVTDRPTVPPTSRPKIGCRITYIPNLIVKSDGDKPEEILTGEYLPNYQTITYSCQPAYLLTGNTKNTCLGNKWTESIPSCISTSTSGCRVTYASNLIVKSEGEKPQEILPGEYVRDYQAISYSCQARHVLTGAKTNYCFENKWTEKIPTCTKYCTNTVLQSATIQASCELKGKRVDCNLPILPGTRVSIACQFGYEKPNFDVRDSISCSNEGEWNFLPYRCKQVCGEEHPDFNPFILGGNKVNNTKVPWHVGIYSSIEKPNEQICGGTIISAKLVISAAHCFWNSTNAMKNDPIYYKIGAGKYYRNYNDRKEPLPVQYSDIQEIHVTDGYKDIQLSYINDIAILVLKTYLKFTFYIKPACIIWKDYSEAPMKSNKIGRVAGWGTTDTGLPSNELNAVELPTLSYDDCISKTQREFQTLITGDKFCVGSSDGQTVCRGDSGGGFVIPIDDTKNIKRYVLQGIVSNGINSNNECTGDFLTAYTNIQYYRPMVESYTDKFEVV